MVALISCRLLGTMECHSEFRMFLIFPSPVLEGGKHTKTCLRRFQMFRIG